MPPLNQTAPSPTPGVIQVVVEPARGAANKVAFDRRQQAVREARLALRRLRGLTAGRTGAIFGRHRGLAQAAWKLVLAGVGATYRWSREAMAAAYRDGSENSFQGWRIAVRYHALHIRVLADLLPEELGGRLEVLERLGELLRQDHDLSVAAARSHHLGSSPLTALVDQRHQALRAMARPLGRRLFHDPTPLFCRRLNQDWNLRKTVPASGADAARHLRAA
jgi:hypothetical protein